jgi:hypothetical protein
MWLFFLEALGALLVFLFIIWWTMFSGRHKGELPTAETPPHEDAPASPRHHD